MRVEVVIQSRLAAIKKRHEEKLFNLRRQNVNVNDSPVITKQIIHNFSLYNLSHDEELALCCSLHQQIPNNSVRNTIKAEFEHFLPRTFYQKHLTYTRRTN